MKKPARKPRPRAPSVTFRMNEQARKDAEEIRKREAAEYLYQREQERAQETTADTTTTIAQAGGENGTRPRT